ncbi:hypothetical protein HYQ46_003600 [Verticillium longisporum]|nr:hypothetical protein HYQ46_003600 [Verticillium longisporum]
MSPPRPVGAGGHSHWKARSKVPSNTGDLSDLATYGTLPTYSGSQFPPGSIFTLRSQTPAFDSCRRCRTSTVYPR